MRLILEGIGVNLNVKNFREILRRFAGFVEYLLEPKITEDTSTTSTSNILISA